MTPALAAGEARPTFASTVEEPAQATCMESAGVEPFAHDARDPDATRHVAAESPLAAPGTRDRRQDELVRRARAGDDEAFALLYVRHADRVTAFARRFVDAHTAEDIASETFRKAYQAIGRFENRSFSGWLLTIARNLVMDHHRAARQIPDDEIEKRIAGSAMSAETEALRHLSDARVAEVLATLPEAQREVMMLRYGADLSNEQVADLLGKPVGAVKSLHHRATTRLAAQLGEPAAL